MRALFASFAMFAGVIVGVTFAGASGGNSAPAGGSAPEPQYLTVTGLEAISDQAGCPAIGVAVGGVTGTASCSDWTTSLHLPNGAVIQKMKAYFQGSTAPGDGEVNFASSDLNDGSDSGTAFRLETDGTPGRITDELVDVYIIDNGSGYHFHLEIELAPGVSYEGTVITYTVPDSGASNANGDVDCNGSVAARDNQSLLRFILGQPPLSQTEPCPDLGS